MYKDKNKQREYQRMWVQNRRTEWLLENGPCIICGSWIDLDVDHINPEDKISHRIWTYTEEKRKYELSKCQVLCHTCHVLKTNSQRKLKPCGTRAGYMRGCRCFNCVEAAKKYRNEQRLGVHK